MTLSEMLDVFLRNNEGIPLIKEHKVLTAVSIWNKGELSQAEEEDLFQTLVSVAGRLRREKKHQTSLSLLCDVFVNQFAHTENKTFANNFAEVFRNNYGSNLRLFLQGIMKCGERLYWIQNPKQYNGSKFFKDFLVYRKRYFSFAPTSYPLLVAFFEICENFSKEQMTMFRMIYVSAIVRPMQYSGANKVKNWKKTFSYAAALPKTLEDLHEFFKSFAQRDETQFQIIKNLPLKNKNLRPFYLDTYANLLSQNGVYSGTMSFHDKATIEHVLAKSLSGSEWKESIGNLFYLQGSINSSYKDSSFDVKKEKYKELGVTSYLKEIVDLDTFGEEQIRARQERIMDVVEKYLYNFDSVVL